MKTIQRQWQHWAQKIQDEDQRHWQHWAQKIQDEDQRHWQHWAQKIQDEDNPETLATLGTEDTG